MDTHRIAIAERCLRASFDKSMAFGDIVGTLIAAGFEGYAVDYRRGTTTYFLPDGDSVVLDSPSPGSVAAPFDAAGVISRIKWAQANPPDYSYLAFCEQVKACGCAGYVVSFLGRRVLYYGRTADTHVEHFQQ